MGHWIVVVDDEALSLTNCKTLLGGEDLKVSCLRSGKDLIRFVEKNTPDLILLDILMPEMDGFETYHALRQFEDENGRSHIPVIFLTGENDSEVERRGLKIGASDFIRKPFDRDVLLRRIHNTVTNSKTIESLTEEATTDKLTGFLNKASGTARVSKLCQECTGALMIMDLDSFKLVNDLFGHDMGDQVLRAFADVVRHSTRENDIVSRIGGDEFMGFFENVTEKSAVDALSRRMNEGLTSEAARLMGEDNGIPLGISIGVVMVPEHGRDYESLFALADSTLYTVKQNGKHGAAIFDQTEGADREAGESPEKEIDRITMILEERNQKGGAMLLGREALAIVYRYLIRSFRDYGGTGGRVLFSLVPAEDGNAAKVPNAAPAFSDLLQEKLRRSDLVMQSRSDSFFVLLTGRDEAACAAQAEEIVKAWEQEHGAGEVRAEYVLSMIG